MKSSLDWLHCFFASFIKPFNLLMVYIASNACGSEKELRMDAAMRICADLAKLGEQAQEYYLNEGCLNTIETLLSNKNFNDMERARYLFKKLTISTNDARWIDLQTKLTLASRSLIYKPTPPIPPQRHQSTPTKTSPVAFIKNDAVDVIMREAQKLSSQTPLHAIQLLEKHKHEFQKNPDRIRMNNLLGHCYLRLEETDKALNCFNEVFKIAEEQQQKIGALLALALTYRKKIEYQKAIDALLEISKIDPPRKNAMDSFIIKLKDAKQSEKSEDHFVSSSHQDIDTDLLVASRMYSLNAIMDIPGDFLELEIEASNIVGLTQRKIENKDYTNNDYEYLYHEGLRTLKGKKPELAAPLFLSSVKIAYLLDQKNDNLIWESLQYYCTAKAKACVMENSNWDVARTYYVETFRFSTNFSTTFDLNQELKKQSNIKLSQYISTYYRAKETFLIKSIAPLNNLLDLFETKNQRTIQFALRGLILISSYNPEVAHYISLMANHDKKLLDSLCNNYINIFRLNNKPQNPDTLENIIKIGINQIRASVGKLVSQFQFFLDKAASLEQIIESSQMFLDMNPPFDELGVNYQGTDSHYFDEMKKILKAIITYEGTTKIDDRTLQHLSTKQTINSLVNTIQHSPTYWGRTYMKSLVRKWEQLLDEDFKKRDEQTSAKLSLEKCERIGARDDGTMDLHVLISNRDGERSASGIKIYILESMDSSYEKTKNYYEITFIQAETTITNIFNIRVLTKEDRLTLNYQICHLDKKGKEIIETAKTLSIPLSCETFVQFDNPYAAYATAGAVTDVSMFKGRDSFIHNIVNLLTLVTTNTAVVIYGQKRSGKSSILYHVENKIQNSITDRFFPVRMDLGKVSGQFDAVNLLFSIINAVTIATHNDSNINFTKAMFLDDPVNEFVKSMKHLIANSSKLKGKTLLLILDEFTYIYDNIKQGILYADFMKSWKAIIDDKLFGLLVAGRDEMLAMVQQNANVFAAQKMLYVDYLDEHGSKSLIEEPIWDKEKNSSRLQEGAVKKIIELTAGNPYYIQIIMNQLLPAKAGSMLSP